MTIDQHGKAIREALLVLCKALDNAHSDKFEATFKLNPITGDRCEYHIEALTLTKAYTYRD